MSFLLTIAVTAYGILNIILNTIKGALLVAVIRLRVFTFQCSV